MSRVHTCERCGCTDTRACPGGCAWLPAYLKVGRHVCTRCASLRARPRFRKRRSRRP